MNNVTVLKENFKWFPKRDTSAETSNSMLNLCIQKRNILRIMLEDIYTPPTDDAGEQPICLYVWHDMVQRVKDTIQVQMDKWFDKLYYASSDQRSNVETQWFQRAVWIVKYWVTNSCDKLRQFIKSRTWRFVAVAAVYNTCPIIVGSKTCTRLYGYCNKPSETEGKSLFSKQEYFVLRRTCACTTDFKRFDTLINAQHMRHIMFVIDRHIEYAAIPTEPMSMPDANVPENTN